MHVYYFRGAFVFLLCISKAKQNFANPSATKKILISNSISFNLLSRIIIQLYIHFNYMLNFPVLLLYAKRVLSVKCMERFWNGRAP